MVGAVDGAVEPDSVEEEVEDADEGERGLEPERERKTCWSGIRDADIYHEEKNMYARENLNGEENKCAQHKKEASFGHTPDEEKNYFSSSCSCSMCAVRSLDQSVRSW